MYISSYNETVYVVRDFSHKSIAKNASGAAMRMNKR